MGVLQERAMLVSLHFKRFGNVKTDREGTEAAQAHLNAESGTGRYDKYPVPKAVLDPINKKFNELYAYHRDMTLPWVQRGPKLLPVTRWKEYVTKVDSYKHEIEEMVEVVHQSWDSILRDAPFRMGKGYNPRDYPQDIRAEYGVDVVTLPVPSSGDWRVDVIEAERAEFSADLEKRLDEAYKLTMREAWAKLAKVVEAMVNKLSDVKAVFRDSLIENVREILALMPSFNIGDDAKLSEIVTTLDFTLRDLDAKDLRKDQELRKATAAAGQAAMDDILEAMEGYK